ASNPPSPPPAPPPDLRGTRADSAEYTTPTRYLTSAPHRALLFPRPSTPLSDFQSAPPPPRGTPHPDTTPPPPRTPALRSTSPGTSRRCRPRAPTQPRSPAPKTA